MATAAVLASVATLVWTGLAIGEARRSALKEDASDDLQSALAVEIEAPPDVPLFTDVFSVTDADAHKGTWFTLDRRASRIHRFDSTGVLIGSFARAGRGPGELTAPEALTIHGDTVVVVERTGGLVHFYDVQGGYLSDRIVYHDGCVGSMTSDVASTASGLLFLVVCADASGALVAHVLLETSTGSSRVIATSSSSRRGSTVLNPDFFPVLSAHPLGFVFGLSGEECLGVFDSSGATLDSICHGWIERFPPPEEMRETLDQLGRRAASVGARFEYPEFLPPFDGVFARDQGRLLYRAPTSTDPDARRLVVQGAGGTEVSLPIPPAPYMFVRQDQVLVAWDDLEGARIAIYELPPSLK